MIDEQKNCPTDARAHIVRRRFSGPVADEIFVQCRPDPARHDDIGRQTAGIYQALQSLLAEVRGSLEHVVHECVHFRNIRGDLQRFQQARQQAYGSACAAVPVPPASTLIEQPPLDTRAGLVLSAVAVIPQPESAGGRSRLPHAAGGAFTLGEQKHLFAGSLHGTPGAGAFDQSYSMFCAAERLLEKEGMNFHNVVRTWIYLRHMERDYAEFNLSRREFFRRRGISLLPASTGICGSPFTENADFALSFYAIQSPRRLDTSAMTTPTLNEARTYGADFSRGLRVVEENKIALYVSGTASVDEAGRTAHVNDFEAQVDRMLLNVSTLLSAQNASFSDVLSAVTYLKNPSDAPRLRRILGDRGLDHMPNATVHAAVCRPDLLCEMEAIAALPLPPG